MKKYEDYLRERAIYDEEMENFNNLLSNITDYKKVSKYIQDKIIELRNHLTEINKVKYNKIKTDDNISYTKISRYNADADHVIREFINLLAEAEETEVYDNYFSSIYPDKNDIDFYPEIDIEIKNLNRIHIPIGLPYIIKGCGLGKKIYKQLIYDLGYLSTTKLDRTMDSIFV